MSDCPDCRGRGYHTRWRSNGRFDLETCWQCAGTGEAGIVPEAPSAAQALDLGGSLAEVREVPPGALVVLTLPEALPPEGRASLSGFLEAKAAACGFDPGQWLVLEGGAQLAVLSDADLASLGLARIGLARIGHG